MTVVAITSSRTSPGATSLAVGMATAWNGEFERSLLIEADPAGGVLAHRFDLAPTPSLTTLGSDIRNAFEPAMIWANTQDLRGVPCIPAPVDPRLARSWVERVVPTLNVELPKLGVPAVIDLGWVDEDGASAALAAAADTTIIVTRPDVAEVQALLFQIRRLEAAGANLALVTVGNSPHDPKEVAELAGIPLLASLPDDARIAAALAGQKFAPKRFRRSLLWRTISGLALSLVDESTLWHAAEPVEFDQPLETLAPQGDGFDSPAHQVVAVDGSSQIPPPPAFDALPVSYAPAPVVIPTTADPVHVPVPVDVPEHEASPILGTAPHYGASSEFEIISETPTTHLLPASVPLTPNPEGSTSRNLTPFDPTTPLFVVAASVESGVDEPTTTDLTVRVAGGFDYRLQPGDTLVIGRRSDCDVTLRDARVSRNHGRIHHTEHGWVYTDLGSRNGTSINGWRCPEALISAGDVITIADFELTLSASTTSTRERACA